jgi:hypothetical protein
VLISAKTDFVRRVRLTKEEQLILEKAGADFITPELQKRADEAAEEEFSKRSNETGMDGTKWINW